jgi:Asp-tRNA(Asn)/Glu-tRNA(Gln) amidotransferase A subunit family amidase
MDSNPEVSLVEATIDDLHDAFRSGRLTSEQLVGRYLDRIEAIDRRGPALNSILSINARAREDAATLDVAYAASGPVGDLHGIPVVLKDQVDVEGMPTTLGSQLFKDYYPARDAFVVQKLRAAGAVILGKTTLGELGGGDTHGSFFGSTRNPYSLTRTVGGSSGGSAAAVAANLATIAIGQEAFASIRRPATWTSIVGMRPSAGLVSRGGVYDDWPKRAGSLGPMARSVRDTARLLDVMVGYDPENPLTAASVGQAPAAFTSFLDETALEGARIGVLRESMGMNSAPGSDDFNQLSQAFDRAVTELQDLGAEIVDPVVIPGLKQLLARRGVDPVAQEESFRRYFERGRNPPYSSWAELLKAAQLASPRGRARSIGSAMSEPGAYPDYLAARNELMIEFLVVMADNRLDAVVHRSMEHQPGLIEDALTSRYVSSRGAPYLNTFLLDVPAITVPAGFTGDGLPAGISFLGRPYQDGRMIGMAYSYEQATRHRRPPALPARPARSC